MSRQQVITESESLSHIRRGQPSGEASRLPAVVVLLCGLVVLASLGMGLITYRYAVKTYRKAQERFCLNEKTLAGYARPLEGASDQEFLERSHTLTQLIGITIASGGLFPISMLLIFRRFSVTRITAQRKAQENYETLFREMIDGFAVHEIICDDAGRPVDYRFLAVNPAFERMTGFRAEQLIGKTVLEVMPNVEKHWIETYGRVSLTDESVHFENYCKELDRYWEVTAFRPEEGQFACIFVDITKEKKLEKEKANLTAQLQKSQRLEMIGTLAGGIAHDFNNILTPIAGFVKMAMDDVPETDKIHEDLKEINKAAQRAIRLVQQMLTFSRQSDSRCSAMSLGPVIEEAVAFIRRSLPGNIPIGLHLDPDCPSVLADSTQIYQVLMHLCTNAAHAMQHAGGCLEISLEPIDIDTDWVQANQALPPGPYLRLAVSDTGVGIDPAVLDRIFDPFYTTKGVGQGTGLGLSVVHGIVKNHGGGIVATSRLGVGTTFEIYLPAVEGQPCYVSIGG